MVMTLFNLNYLLKTYSLDIVTLGVEASKYKFWDDTIQSIALDKHRLSPFWQK